MSGYFGCTCDAGDGEPHCHTGGGTPEGTPRTSGRRWCVYGGIGCNVDHDAIARASGETERKVDHLVRTATVPIPNAWRMDPEDQRVYEERQADTGLYLKWCGRLLILGLLALAVVFGMGAAGVLEQLSDGVSALVGMALGCLCLVGAFYWTDRSDA